MTHSISTDCLINHILSGILYFNYKGQKCYIKTPSLQLRYQASLYQQSILDSLKYNDWLLQSSFYNTEYKHSVSELDKNLDSAKVRLFHCYSKFRSKSMPQVKQQIKLIKEKLGSVQKIATKYWNYTKEGYAYEQRHLFLLIRTIYGENEQLFFASANEASVDYMALNRIMAVQSKWFLSHDELRSLSRSTQWRNIWSLSQGNPFGGPTAEWSQDQIVISSYSKMHDNIYQSMECPSDEVMKDDDALDGWQIIQSREIKESRLNKEREKMSGDGLGRKNKPSLSSDVYLPARNIEEFENIENLNTIQALGTKIDRKRTLKSRGDVLEQHLPDIKRGVIMQASQQQKRG